MKGQVHCHGNPYLYDVENRLVEKRAIAGGTVEASLRYDPMGRLYETVGPSTGTTRFLIDGDAIVAEYDAGGVLKSRYVHGADGKADDPIAWYKDGVMVPSAVRFLYANHQGSIILAAAGLGSSASSQFKYDEYGNAQMVSGAAGCAGSIAVDCGGRFLYTGQALIPELAMYYYKARVYSPQLGRFMQTDPIGYVSNDPVNKTDPTGTCGRTFELPCPNRPPSSEDWKKAKPYTGILLRKSSSSAPAQSPQRSAPSSGTTAQGDKARAAGTAAGLVGATQDALAKAGQLTGATAADVAPIKGLGVLGGATGVLATVDALHKEGHSIPAQVGGTLASVATGMAFTKIGNSAGGAFGGPPGAVIGTLIAAGADAYFNASDNAGKAVANAIDGR